MNYHRIEKYSTNNGPGIRVVLWESGCSLRCKGCHNPETWDRYSGMIFDDAAFEEFMDACNHDWVSGITLSGGHPMESYNLYETIDLVNRFKKRFPEKTVWLYTGFVVQEKYFNSILMNMYSAFDAQKLLYMCDVVVDGPYIEELRDLKLKFRGSSNQRIIDVRESMKVNRIILWEE